MAVAIPSFLFLYWICYVFCFGVDPIDADLRTDTVTDAIDLNRCLPEDLCNRLICPEITEPCQGTIVQGVSVCGCCEECVQDIADDADCLNVPYSPGGKPLQMCRSGSYCDEELGICKPNKELPICRAAVEEIKKIKELSSNKLSIGQIDFSEISVELSDDLWMPDCDHDGLFLPKQCKAKKCFCMDKEGTRIFGQAEKELSANMTCACSVAVQERKLREKAAWMTKPHERCTETGDYEELQCVDHICYCANTTTGKPLGHMVRIEQIEFLSCYKPKTLKESYLTNCEKQEIRERKVNYEFDRKGIDIKGFSTLSCDFDGTFAARQCDTPACYCTQRKGLALKSYKLGKEGQDETLMNCRCARDEYDNEVNHARYPRWKCTGVGNFGPDQCLGKDCWCIDEDGDILTKMSSTAKGFHHAYCQTLNAVVFNMENIILRIKDPSIVIKPIDPKPTDPTQIVQPPTDDPLGPDPDPDYPDDSDYPNRL